MAALKGQLYGVHQLEPALISSVADAVDQHKGRFFVRLQLVVLLGPPAIAAGVVRKAKVEGRCSGVVDHGREVVGGQDDGTAADVFQGDNHLDHVDDAVFLGAKDLTARLAAHIANAIHGAGNFNIFAAA